jgi:hypothetical protein
LGKFRLLGDYFLGLFLIADTAQTFWLLFSTDKEAIVFENYRYSPNFRAIFSTEKEGIILQTHLVTLVWDQLPGRYFEPKSPIF